MTGTRRRRTTRRAVALALALVLLVALPASAHPFIRGGEVPVDSLATITLDLAHGCESEDAGEGTATTDVALQVPDWLRIVDVPEPGGWTVELESPPDDSSIVEVVTWTTPDPQEPAPAFDLDVVATGEVGDELYLGVFQACGDVVYRWVGTPDDPADDPAIQVLLVEADPDSPPPPEPEPAPEPESEPDDPEADPAPDEDDPATDDAETADEPVVTDESDEETDADEPTEDVDADEAAAPDEGGGLAWLWIAIIAVAVAVVAFVATRVRGRGEGGASSGEGTTNA